MKHTRLLLTSFVLLAAFAAPAHAQTLGDAAKREAERRARLKETPKVITNADLDALPARGGAAPAARPDAVLPSLGAEAPVDAADAAATAAATVTPSEGEPQAQPTVRVKRDEEHWRERAQVIRERLTRLQSDAAALDGRVKSLNAEIDAGSGSEKTALAADLREASAALARVQEELRLIQGEWRAFEDRAAQAKVPPAWIR